MNKKLNFILLVVTIGTLVTSCASSLDKASLILELENIKNYDSSDVNLMSSTSTLFISVNDEVIEDIDTIRYVDASEGYSYISRKGILFNTDSNAIEQYSFERWIFHDDGKWYDLETTNGESIGTIVEGEKETSSQLESIQSSITSYFDELNYNLSLYISELNNETATINKASKSGDGSISFDISYDDDDGDKNNDQFTFENYKVTEQNYEVKNEAERYKQSNNIKRTFSRKDFDLPNIEDFTIII